MSYWCCSVCVSPRQPRGDWAQCLINPSLKCHYCGSCPLDEAIRSRGPDDVILALLAGNRDAVMTHINGIDLPLHKAMTSKCSDTVVLALLAANGVAAVKESANGELPLHLALKNGFSDTVCVAIFLSYTCAAMIRCKVTEMLPLHLAATSSASPWVVEALLREYPEALEIVANCATPRDLVTSALPVDSIRMICRPSLYWKRALSTIVPKGAHVPALEAGDAGRDISVASCMQPFEVESVKAQVHSTCSRTEPQDWASTEVTLMKAQVRPKCNKMEPPQDRAATLSEVHSVELQVSPARKNMEPDDRVAKRSKVNSLEAQGSLIFNEMEQEGGGSSKFSQALSIKAHGRLDVTSSDFVQRHVQHDYHDHSTDSLVENRSNCNTGRFTQIFPTKLHECLDRVEADGYGRVISWQPHGRAFRIHKMKEFAESVMPLYFPKTKLSSFRRQLNLYNFLRISKRLDKGAYYHELFLRGKPFLANSMVRQKVKGTFAKRVQNPIAEPLFYRMPFVGVTTSICTKKSSNPVVSNNTNV